MLHSALDFPSPTFAYIVFGTVLANLFVFHIIEYVAAGFSIICSYFSSQEKEEIGLLYQKTLGITFLICVIMTPIIFIMDKILGLFGYGSFLYICRLYGYRLCMQLHLGNRSFLLLVLIHRY